MRKKGNIAAWNEEKGYGFIKPIDGGSQIFVHIRAFASRNRRPAVGKVVTYAITKDSQGRLRAEGATPAGDKLWKAPKRKSSAPAIMVALLGGWPGALVARDSTLLVHSPLSLER